MHYIPYIIYNGFAVVGGAHVEPSPGILPRFLQNPPNTSFFLFQKSATYSCLVQDRDLSTELNATVDVLDARLVSPCPAVRHLGVAWPAAAPGTAALAECPAGYAGAARRRCAPLERGRAAWGAADFSGCQHRRVREEVVKVGRDRGRNGRGGF